MGRFDLWTVLRVFELVLVVACLVFKRVTDDEARSLFLYLQKISREWSLLTNVTWDRVGASVADATYGGYTVITSALLIGKLTGDLPTKKRVAELILLGVGAILFVIMGSLAFAAIEYITPKLVDNAAILGTLSLLTGALFLLDMAAPKAKEKQLPAQQQQPLKTTTEPDRPSSITQQIIDIEREIERSERESFDRDDSKAKTKKDVKNNGIRNGNGGQRKGNSDKADGVSGQQSRSYIHLDPTTKGYKQMRDDDPDVPKRFGIYGKDVGGYDSETDETASIPPKFELHAPVWSQIRQGRSGSKGRAIPPVVLPSQKPPQDVPERPPSGPSDPGYVQYTAQHWGDTGSTKVKTPRSSPTAV
ncbi:uncharacterized protein LOC132699953 [Cylas formicarius]|uniref:uncharacterized protein LOC132699953 n=1 Tax=Cylas formicarius TaxID=197179 RepID=UPI0029586657|nr:uncharacterized protein LOC132699953 [Cylas formicarius]XP_060522942.1 uncharacterized protein LOC132699953 [Cylas formicarius]